MKRIKPLLAAAGLVFAGGFTANAQLYWQPQADGTFGTAANWSTTTPGYTANTNTINANWIVATFNTATPAFQPTTATDSNTNFVGRIDILSTSGALTFGGAGTYGVRRGASGVYIQSATSVNQTFSAGVALGRSGTASALDADLNNTGSGTVIFNGALTARAGELNSIRFTAGKWEVNGGLDTNGKLVNIFGGSSVRLNASAYTANNEIRVQQGSTLTLANNINNGWITLGGTLGGAASVYVTGNGTTINRWIGNNNQAGTYTQTVGFSGTAGQSATFDGGAASLNLANVATVTQQFDSGAGTLNIGSGIAGGNAGLVINKIGSGTVVLNGANANSYTASSFNVTAGTLVLAKTGGVAAITGATAVASGATLRLDAANQIADTGALTLNAGTFNVNGFSETLAGLTLGGAGNITSFLDFGSGTSTLLFSGITVGAAGNKLAITNWTFGSDSLRFTSNANLTADLFTVNGGAAAILNQGSYYEVVPEPSTWMLLAIGLTVMVVLRRRRA